MDGRVKVNNPLQINCFYKFCAPLNVFHTSDQKPSKSELTAAQLAQFDKRRSVEREAAVSNPGRTSTRGLTINIEKVLPL